MTAAFVLSNVMVTVTALLAIACVVSYQVTTGGAWRSTETGRHLMAFMASEATVLALGLVRQVGMIFGLIDPQWFQLLRLAVFISVPAVFAWRLRLIIVAYQERLGVPVTPSEDGVS